MIGMAMPKVIVPIVAKDAAGIEAKGRELTAKGCSPDVVGQLLPKFHGAGCVSDLKADDYPAFLEELAKL
mgnify:CR=1 FL=1